MRNVTFITVSVLAFTVIGCVPEVVVPEVPSRQMLAEAGLQYYWPLTLPLAEGETVQRMQLLDENLYVLTSENRLVAIDAAIGVPKWSCRVADPGEAVFRPCHADSVILAPEPLGVAQIMGWKPSEATEPVDTVMINTVEFVMVLDRSTGKEYRKIPFKFSANSAGASDGQHFYVGSTNGRYYCFALNEAVELWSLSTDNMISAPLETSGGYLYVASEDYRFYCTRTGTRGNPVWSQKLDGAVTVAFHVDQRGCFVPCEDNRLYAFDSMTGANIWGPLVFRGPLSSPVQAGKETIFQCVSGDGFYAINIANGRIRWYKPDVLRVLALVDGNVYLLDTKGTLLVVDEILGETKHSLRLTGMEFFAINVEAPAVYAATWDGRIFCIRSLKAGELTAEMLRSGP